MAVFVEDILRAEGSKDDVAVTITTEGEPWPCDSFVVRQAVKVIREAFSNAVRHGEADSVMVEFRYVPEQLVVRLVDDGKGFVEEGSSTPGHYGIVGMKERAALIDAKLEIASRKGEGTEVMLTIPSSPRQG